ncbi:MAG: PLDc N-terminal domain-containing protein [Rhodobacteraceae bacterium]|nr:PLDc N-terminal domain-containing protein [Paracoccaceae bacterium]
MHLGNVSFGNFLLDILFIVFFVVWFWMIITVMVDLLRRHDLSGWAKVIWVIFLVVLPYIGVFAYLVTQSGSMARRSAEQAEEAREQLRKVVGFSVADEIEKLDRLKASGSLSETEYKALRAKLV